MQYPHHKSMFQRVHLIETIILTSKNVFHLHNIIPIPTYGLNVLFTLAR
jgi:hypothetical protein